MHGASLIGVIQPKVDLKSVLTLVLNLNTSQICGDSVRKASDRKTCARYGLGKWGVNYQVDQGQ